MKASLSIIWDKEGYDNESLFVGSLNEIDKYILENYKNSEEIRQSSKYKQKIDNFLLYKPIPEKRKNHRGSIVILKYKDNLEIEKSKIMYQKDVDDAVNFIKYLSKKMLNDKQYTSDVLKLFPNLFTESERRNLFTDINYNKKSYYQTDIVNWKNKFIKSPNYVNHLRNLYRIFERQIKELKKQKQLEKEIERLEKEEKLLAQTTYYEGADGQIKIFPNYGETKVLSDDIKEEFLDSEELDQMKFEGLDSKRR